MKVKQLRKVMNVDEEQRVRINDIREDRYYETDYGWYLDEDGELKEYLMNLTVDETYFHDEWLYIWAH